MLEKGWNPKLPVATLKKDLVDINPTASSFKLLLHKVRHHANQSMNDAFEYAKQKWDKSRKKLKDSFAGTLIIKALHGTNAVQVELSGELENKHPTFSVTLSEEKKVLKFLKERRLRGKDEREYLDRYRNAQHEDEWIVAEKISDSQKLLRRFRHERRPIPHQNI
ncbi:hypothetical protein O181_132300 [Austropuccinia psidii MF-1]|uniref:Uncharacterized protein n=1 Tax=Austropuccinia psidii MF-1 TaxID=1389203 RepID=A0A9Q3L6P3_9BASI|nr:hypothetical protein [Austropuccinia psidii MF-1]